MTPTPIRPARSGRPLASSAAAPAAPPSALRRAHAPTPRMGGGSTARPRRACAPGAPAERSTGRARYRPIRLLLIREARLDEFAEALEDPGVGLDGVEVALAPVRQD